MPLISPGDQERLRQQFARMTRPVRLVFFTQTIGCDTCADTRRILDELPPLSDKVAIDEVNFVLDGATAAQYGVDRVPSVALAYQDEHGNTQDSRIRFVGTPAGYEFLSLVQAVVLVGGGESTLSDQSRRRLASIDRAVTLQVFTTPG
jgi:alkyl hydroperoxide reductase subunit AhpF